MYVVLLEYWRHDIYKADLGPTLKPYDAEAAQAVLARLAWWMHQQQDRTSAPLDDLAEEAKEGLAQVSPSSGLGKDGRGFLERMRDEAGYRRRAVNSTKASISPSWSKSLNRTDAAGFD